jgi:hypothetical protein
LTNLNREQFQRNLFFVEAAFLLDHLFPDSVVRVDKIFNFLNLTEWLYRFPSSNGNGFGAKIREDEAVTALCGHAFTAMSK